MLDTANQLDIFAAAPAAQPHKRVFTEATRPSEIAQAYILHTDPGHGWLCVPYDEMHRLGLMKRVSGYSYRCDKRKQAFLEEDEDLSLFVDAKTARGEPVFYILQHREGYNFIRDLPRFAR